MNIGVDLAGCDDKTTVYLKTPIEPLKPFLQAHVLLEDGQEMYIPFVNNIAELPKFSYLLGVTAYSAKGL